MKNYLMIGFLTCFLSACMPPNNTNNQEENVAVSPPPVIDPTMQKGEALFKQHCTSCHKANAKLIGPALKGVSQKYNNDKKWLYAYIKNSQALLKAGDKRAVAIHKEYGAVMNTFMFFTDEEIEAILQYLEPSLY